MAKAIIYKGAYLLYIKGVLWFVFSKLRLMLQSTTWMLNNIIFAGLSTGAIVGVAAGITFTFIAIVLVTVIILCIMQRDYRTRNMPTGKQFMHYAIFQQF